MRCFVHFESFWLGHVLRATTACTFSTSQLPKVVRTWGVFSFFTCKCALRHNGVHFFDIATSKSGPNMVCFVHFDFEMCFAPQRRARFRHLNFQKWTWCALCILTWKCSSCHNGVQFFISHLARWLRTRYFSEPTFDPPEPQIIGKTRCFATFLPFRPPGSSFFWDFIFFDLLSSSLLFADSSHLCFSSVHIVGSLTSKLLSIISITWANIK